MKDTHLGHPTLEEQLCMLDLSDVSNEGGISTSDVSATTLFSSDLLKEPSFRDLLPQYGLIGTTITSPELHSIPKLDRRLFLNTNIPWSAFICGVQGSGKSHTMSCLLENCLMSSREIGVLKRPLSALVFYYGQYTSSSNFEPCEAAYLSAADPQFSGLTAPKVRVLASPSNVHSLKEKYTKIPGVQVRTLKLLPKHLSVSSMLSLMSVDQSHSAPLYMAQVVSILRGMAAEGKGILDFKDFKRRLDNAELNGMQRNSLNQRMELLESFLDLSGMAVDCFKFEQGGITIIDLSCPFMDPSTACALFDICMGIYLGNSSSSEGKIIAVDEAHKYLTNTSASRSFTESLLGVIRQQRHYGARVIISTQEPTVSPNLIDLCSMVIIHQFKSPAWFNVLRKHIPTKEENEERDLFDRIVGLRTGEALVFSHLAVVNHVEGQDLKRSNAELLRVRVRKRLTVDGGKSIVCV